MDWADSVPTEGGHMANSREPSAHRHKGYRMVYWLRILSCKQNEFREGSCHGEILNTLERERQDDRG